ncbi:hypothetical protein MGG_15635 [Pyricularia oryzae 70-15]|uniref:Uncharacterized protein n=1 Tax=Pyricularia oryzae (strain 70-15 / ATCC MYA-4617 / FGSC 8958) TaxID=242507 RepID=G4MWX8_PYRO7|nr:uncharacterized protein MGG_15635 [Pyricularia oryzae 70-15]EHA54270.1 hypothetical protein MGG_15635 [Pyricularia oryzae 70-15]
MNSSRRLGCPVLEVQFYHARSGQSVLNTGAYFVDHLAGDRQPARPGFNYKSCNFSLPVLISVLEDGKEGRDGMLTATGRGI